ncbi:MAG: alpha/beta hydrolase [Austwickia sp.]|nr:MAG: alpha/beta hydrolase [Austwickia sp.]
MISEPRLLETPAGRVEWTQFGRGEPVTVFAHGLGQSIESTRPFASGVRGRRVFFHFRGHGRSEVGAGAWSYGGLAAQLRAVADASGATRALGVSMGAGALCALLAQTPDRFERVILVLPAALDTPRAGPETTRADRLAALLDAGDADALARALAQEQAAGPQAAAAVAHWADAHARWLVGSGAPSARTGTAEAFRRVPRSAPVPDPAVLARVRAPALVIAQEEDPVHPVEVARELAAALPAARLVVLPPGGLLWAHRVTLRGLVTEFLAAPSGRDAEGDSS